MGLSPVQHQAAPLQPNVAPIPSPIGLKLDTRSTDGGGASIPARGVIRSVSLNHSPHREHDHDRQHRARDHHPGNHSNDPEHADEYESQCGHVDCTRAFAKEIVRVGLDLAEEMCLVRERADDEAYYRASDADDRAHPEFDRR